MDERYLADLVDRGRRELADELADLAKQLDRKADRLRRASNSKELSSAFNPYSEVQHAFLINSLCGRLGAYIRLLERIAPATEIGPLS